MGESQNPCVQNLSVARPLLFSPYEGGRPLLFSPMKGRDARAGVLLPERTQVPSSQVRFSP